jgi:arsenate reductase
MKLSIWHNQQCSTSRKVLDFLQSKNDDIDVRNYIQNPPTVEELHTVLKKMIQPAEYIVRKADKVYKEKFEGKLLTNDQWIYALSENPSMIQRPMVITNTKAYLARPADEFIANWKN